MNAHLAKFIMYYEVQRMHREGHSKSKISDLLVINRRTIRKYLSMTEADYEAFLIKQGERKKELRQYEGFVKERLGLYAETSAAQMHDWLKEHYPDFPKLNAKTVFNFVHWVRDKYNIPKVSAQRQYLVVEELAYGKQAQVDFGEYNMRTSSGKRVKVYFFTLVLSRSRYKYIWFTEKPFTSNLSIQAHELAFAYIHGIPDEIVYDQDKVFIVSENSGDIILTDLFRNYTRDKSFQLHFCRKSDPESKGKVENVVKYVKQNFLYNRTFYNAETLNDEALGWLGRTANAMVHSVTLKEPHSEWIIEQEYLKENVVALPLKPESLLYTVKKDNTISWKSNLYSLPLGTYAGRGTQVGVQLRDDALVMLTTKGDELCRHNVASGKGLKIINTDHKRDKTGVIKEMIVQVSGMTQQPQQAKDWLTTIRAAKLSLGMSVINCYWSGKLLRKQNRFLSLRRLLTAYRIILPVLEILTLIIKQHQRSVSTGEHKVIPLNPLSGSHLQNAIIEPQRSAIEDYQSIIKKSSERKMPSR